MYVIKNNTVLLNGEPVGHSTDVPEIIKRDARKEITFDEIEELFFSDYRADVYGDHVQITNGRPF